MGDMQASVNGTSLDNGSWRVILGDISCSEGMDGKVTCTADFHVEADDADTLQSRINTTYDSFRKQNPTCIFTLDSAATNKMRSIAPGDGRHLAVVSTVVEDPEHKGTLYSAGFTLVVIAELAIASSVGITGLESMTQSEVYNSGRSRVRQVVGTFISIGGQSAALNYAAARSQLLTDYMLTESTGAYSSANKFVLVDEKTDDPGAVGLRLNFSLESEYQVFPMASTPEARSSTIEISTSIPDEWDERGGTRPTLIHAQGAVFLSITALQGGVLQAWDHVEADIRAAIAQETGKSDLQIVKTDKTSDADLGILKFSVAYIADNTVVLSLQIMETITTTLDTAEAVDSDGYDYVQRSPKPLSRQRSISATRVGIGLVNLRAYIGNPQPTLPDHNAVELIGETASDMGEITTEFGRLRKQSSTFTFRERKYRTALPPLEFPVPAFGG